MRKYTTEQVRATDAAGNPVIDAHGNPVYIQVRRYIYPKTDPVRNKVLSTNRAVYNLND